MALLKLINAGLGRTGTSSLKIALERLGFGPCYHMFDIVSSEKRLAQWESVICDARRPDWHEIFDGFTSAANGPCAVYYRQLAEAFPEAKVVLTVRDAERWYQSTHDTLYQSVVRAGEKFRGSRDHARSREYRVFRMTDAMTWTGLFGGRFADRRHAIRVFHDHNAEVRRTIDPDRLLVYDVRQGWEPLCAFLGVPVPPEGLPKVNDQASMSSTLARAGAGDGPPLPAWARRSP